MKSHYCKQEKTAISYEGECNWCGEKEMKPIAWTDDLWTIFEHEDYLELDDELKEGMIPLYTSPQKNPLSDEEINNISKESLGINIEQCSLSRDIDLLAFAKAIEERHGIK